MKSDECTSVLKALSEDTRWRIVQALLLTERANVTDLSESLVVSQPNVSKHLRILRESKIVVTVKDGTVVWCSITPEFRQRVRSGEPTLELGCCTFRFDQPAGK
jgi:DNA-binding transcriptional ArsR family regulator